MTDEKNKPHVGGSGKDAIDTFPLESIPLSSSSLKQAKLVKNARMETAVEIHSDPLSGSLQVSPETISDFMSATPEDQAIIDKLAGLDSFDVYSLRSNLKSLGVEVQDVEALELSDDMKEGLSMYSLEFISPLVEKIFGRDREDLKSSAGLTKIIQDSDVSKVKSNLKLMAEKTGIPLAEIPEFLQEYSEVYLSVAYYRYSFESIGADIERFLFWVDELKTSREVTTNPIALKQCRITEAVIRFLQASIRERLVKFRSSFEMFWLDINRDSFLEMRKQIEENHGTMGAVLCGLVVKMNGWKKEFPSGTSGSPSARLKFIISEMEPGLLKVKDLENHARRMLGLSTIKI